MKKNIRNIVFIILIFPLFYMAGRFPLISKPHTKFEGHYGRYEKYDKNEKIYFFGNIYKKDKLTNEWIGPDGNKPTDEKIQELEDVIQQHEIEQKLNKTLEDYRKELENGGLFRYEKTF